MTERIDHGAHDLAWPGRRISTGETVPGPGSWEIVDHRRCPDEGKLRALTPGQPAPTCLRCGRDVVWQLTHMASSVAADHRGVGRLP